eukprot:1152439-Pelagomonas_calceolata.AAC.2
MYLMFKGDLWIIPEGITDFFAGKKVGPRAHWGKGLFRNLGEAGCTISGYVSVPLLECYKNACQCSSNDSTLEPTNSAESLMKVPSVWQDGRLPLPESICASRYGCLGEGIQIPSSNCLILSTGACAVLWQNLSVEGVASELLVSDDNVAWGKKIEQEGGVHCVAQELEHDCVIMMAEGVAAVAHREHRPECTFQRPCCGLIKCGEAWRVGETLGIAFKPYFTRLSRSVLVVGGSAVPAFPAHRLAHGLVTLGASVTSQKPPTKAAIAHGSFPFLFTWWREYVAPRSYVSSPVQLCNFFLFCPFNESALSTNKKPGIDLEDWPPPTPELGNGSCETG